MNTALAGGIFAVALLVCFNDWRRGLLLCVVVGFLQDPLRKLAPGRPVAFVVLVAVFFLASLIGAAARGQKLGGRQLVRWFPSLRAPLAAFAVVIALQSAATYLRYRNPVLAGLGLLGYLSPIAALLAFFHFSSSWQDAKRWISLYLSCAGVVALTVLMQFAGVSSRLFDSIGIDTVYGIGGRIAMQCGIMRSSEIAAFHLAVGACLALTLAASGQANRIRKVYLLLVPVFLLAIALTGRRKMLVQFVLFVVVFLFLVLRSRRSMSRASSLIGMSVLVVFLLAMSALVQDPGADGLTPYLARSTSVFEESGTRLYGMTIGSFESVLSTSGILGAGAGTTAQGSQYYGGAANIVRGAAEGGVAKVLAEIGIPGLLCLLWFGIHILFALRDVARSAAKAPPEHAVLVFGLIAFLPSHAAVFATAHQVYGDPFVLLVLGSMIGFALSSPRILACAGRQTTANRLATTRGGRVTAEGVRRNGGIPVAPTPELLPQRPRS